MRAVRHDDGTILPMQANGPGTNDCVSHTLRHFVREGSHIAAVAAGEIDAPTAQARLLAQGVPMKEIGGLPMGEARLSSFWSNRKHYDLVLPLHEHGYAPRYLAIARSSPLPERAGSRWIFQDPATPKAVRIVDEAHDVIVCGSWQRGRQTLAIRTTLDRARFVEPKPPPATDPALARLRGMLRNR